MISNPRKGVACSTIRFVYARINNKDIRIGPRVTTNEIRMNYHVNRIFIIRYTMREKEDIIVNNYLKLENSPDKTIHELLVEQFIANVKINDKYFINII